jgi:hypothetical protein
MMSWLRTKTREKYGAAVPSPDSPHVELNLEDQRVRLLPWPFQPSASSPQSLNMRFRPANAWTLGGKPSESKHHLNAATFTAVRGTVIHRVVVENDGLWLHHFRSLVPLVTADILFASLKRGQAITFPGTYTSDQLQVFRFRDLKI